MSRCRRSWLRHRARRHSLIAAFRPCSTGSLRRVSRARWQIGVAQSALDLTSLVSYGGLLDSTASRNGSHVIPGNPDESRLVWKLRGFDARGRRVFGDSMPLGRPLLEASEIATIRPGLRRARSAPRPLLCPQRSCLPWLKRRSSSFSNHHRIGVGREGGDSGAGRDGPRRLHRRSRRSVYRDRPPFRWRHIHNRDRSGSRA